MFTPPPSPLPSSSSSSSLPPMSTTPQSHLLSHPPSPSHPHPYPPSHSPSSSHLHTKSKPKKKHLSRPLLILIFALPTLLVLLALRHKLSTPTDRDDITTALEAFEDTFPISLSELRHQPPRPIHPAAARSRSFLALTSLSWLRRRNTHSHPHSNPRRRGAQPASGSHSTPPAAPSGSLSLPGTATTPSAPSSPSGTGSASSSNSSTPSGSGSDTGTDSDTNAPVPTVPADSSNPPIPTPFPQPFDVSLSTNFTTVSCQNFFGNFTQSLSFRGCRSFGLLLANSNAFFQQETNLTEINIIVYGTCHARSDPTTCEGTMDMLASQLRVSCAKDLKAGNALAINALVGFSNYALYYHTGCLVNPGTNEYCYVSALSQTSNAADLYFYSLPLGISLPNTTNPSCSQCTKSVMSIYSQYASNATLPISKTYPAAQSLTEQSCGDGYSTPVAVVGSALSRHRQLSGLLVALLSAALAIVLSV